VEGGIDTVIPVSAYIPGCPASPTAIMDGVVKLLASLEASEKPPAPAAPPQDEMEMVIQERAKTQQALRQVELERR
jgi:Ni,Fe-hydrogenase III small subunit